MQKKLNTTRRLTIFIALISVVFLSFTLVPEKTSLVNAMLSQIEQKNFSGVILIAKGDKVLYEKSYGFSSCDARVKNTPETVHSIGSITKMFTAVAIAQLEAQKRIDMDKPVSTYLKNIPEDKASITVRQLLEHKAGLETYHETKNLGDFQAMTRKQALSEILNKPSRNSFEEHYSNSGYTLLAVLIETVSGKNYTTYIRDNILNPAGMTSTGFWGEQFSPIASTPNEVLGCSSPDKWNYSWVIVGNGGMVSTAADLHRWVRALKGNVLLSETAKKRIGYDAMFAEGFGDAGGSDQHQFNATIEYDAKQDITVVAISNRSTLPAEDIAIDLLHVAIKESKLND